MARRPLASLALALSLLAPAAARAGALATPLAPMFGVGGGNTVHRCSLINASTKSPVRSGTITEYQPNYCEIGGNPCHTVVKQSVTCAELQPGDFCMLNDSSTGLAQPGWCHFEFNCSPKNFRAAMDVRDKNSGETMAVIPAQ